MIEEHVERLVEILLRGLAGGKILPEEHLRARRRGTRATASIGTRQFSPRPSVGIVAGLPSPNVQPVKMRASSFTSCSV